MEEFLNSVQKTKECFEKYDYDTLMKMKSSLDIQHVCLSEKLELSKIIMSDKLKTYNLNRERITILKQREKEIKNQRRSFLDESCGFK